MNIQFIPMQELEEKIEILNMEESSGEKRVSVPKDFKLKTETDRFGVDYYVWEKFPEKLTISEEFIGKRVWIAGNPKTYITYLKSILPEGHGKQPNGGVMVAEKGLDYPQCYELNSVIIHPDNFKKEVKKRKRRTKEEMKLAEANKKPKQRNFKKW